MISFINDKKLIEKNKFDVIFAYYKNVNLAYNFKFIAVLSDNLNGKQEHQNSTPQMNYKLTSAFYEGFGIN